VVIRINAGEALQSSIRGQAEVTKGGRSLELVRYCLPSKLLSSAALNVTGLGIELGSSFPFGCCLPPAGP